MKTKLMQRVHCAATPIAIAIISLFTAAAQAGSAAGETKLETVEVKGAAATAGGLPANLGANSAGYSAKELAEQVNVINTEDIVKYSPDTMTRKRYIGDRNAIIQTRTSSVTSSARALVYADDVLLSNLLGNGYAYPARWNMVSPLEVKRVDFFFGPYSAEYPGNSVGTTVLITTRMPTRFEGYAKAQAFSESFNYGGTQASYQGGNANAVVGSRQGGFAWLVDANHLLSNGHPMTFATFNPALDGKASGTGPQVNGVVTDTDINGAPRINAGSQSQEHTLQDTAKIKLAWDFAPGWQATYLLGNWRNNSTNQAASYLKDASTGATVSKGGFQSGGKFYQLGNAFAGNVWDQSHWLNAATLKSQGHAEWNGELVLSHYSINSDLQRSNIPAGAKVGSTSYFGQISSNPLGDGWQSLEAKAFWRPKSGDHQAVFGVHSDRYRLDAKAFYSSAIAGDESWKSAASSGQLASASQGQTRTQAIYAQDAWRLLPDWKLIAGLRSEHWQASGGGNSKLLSGAISNASYSDRTINAVSPKLSIEHGISADWTIKGSIGSAHRMPTVTELFQAISVGANITTNNPALLPEHALSSELTAERELSGGLLRLSLFNEDMKNALYSQPLTVGTVTTTAVQNIEQVRSYGATLAFQKNNLLPGLDFTGSLTWAHARTLADAATPAAVGKVFPGIPDWRATAVATWHANERGTISLAARYSGDQFNTLVNTDSNRDTYSSNSRFFIVDARASWRFDQGLTAAVGVDNIGNQVYFAYHPMPMRTVHAELSAAF